MSRLIPHRMPPLLLLCTRVIWLKMLLTGISLHQWPCQASLLWFILVFFCKKLTNLAKVILCGSWFLHSTVSGGCLFVLFLFEVCDALRVKCTGHYMLYIHWGQKVCILYFYLYGSFSSFSTYDLYYPCTRRVLHHFWKLGARVTFYSYCVFNTISRVHPRLLTLSLPCCVILTVCSVPAFLLVFGMNFRTKP